jgi:hypothetical protein
MVHHFKVYETPFFIAMGALGGFLGANFNRLYEILSLMRRKRYASSSEIVSLRTFSKRTSIFCCPCFTPLFRMLSETRR